MIPTVMLIYRPGLPKERREINIPARPDLTAIHALVDPHLNGGDLEHVSVLFAMKPADMFVDDSGRLKGLPRNERATAIYRASWMNRYPMTDPETLNWIAGPAVLFTRRIWF